MYSWLLPCQRPKYTQKWPQVVILPQTWCSFLPRQRLSFTRKSMFLKSQKYLHLSWLHMGQYQLWYRCKLLMLRPWETPRPWRNVKNDCVNHCKWSPRLNIHENTAWMWKMKCNKVCAAKCGKMQLEMDAGTQTLVWVSDLNPLSIIFW